MMLIRPVRLEDQEQVLQLAKEAGVGMTSLPQDAKILRDKITNAVNSFAGHPVAAGEEDFLFVLEDVQGKRLAGTTAIKAHVGMTRPFYSYKISIITQASTVADVYSRQKVLHMVNDYTGASEIGSLFLSADYRRDGLGRFLSRCRYLMLAEFPALFSDTVISEIRGVQDVNGESPFYNNLAKHFFQMEFKKADFISATQGNQFIADLMPKYPIYTALLPQEARAVIGTPFEASRPALEMLMQEGFHYEGYVDVFDGGPTVQAERARLGTVRDSQRLQVSDIRVGVTGERYMVTNTVKENFRAVLGDLVRLPDDTVILDEQDAALLGVRKYDYVRVAI